MAPALVGVDIIGVGEDAFFVAVVILKGYINDSVALFPLNVDRFAVDGCAVSVQMFHKLFNTALVLEYVLLVGSLVLDSDLDPGVEKRKLSQALGEDVKGEFICFEDLGIGQKRYFCSLFFGFSPVRCTVFILSVSNISAK